MFTLRTAEGKAREITGTYKIQENGVLTITPDNGNTLVISPTGWLSLELTEAPQRGGDRGGTSI
jgi:hypothetical protein